MRHETGHGVTANPVCDGRREGDAERKPRDLEADERRAGAADFGRAGEDGVEVARGCRSRRARGCGNRRARDCESRRSRGEERPRARDPLELLPLVTPAVKQEEQQLVLPRWNEEAPPRERHARRTRHHAIDIRTPREPLGAASPVKLDETRPFARSNQRNVPLPAVDRPFLRAAHAVARTVAGGNERSARRAQRARRNDDIEVDEVADPRVPICGEREQRAFVREHRHACAGEDIRDGREFLARIERPRGDRETQLLQPVELLGWNQIRGLRGEMAREQRHHAMLNRAVNDDVPAGNTARTLAHQRGARRVEGGPRDGKEQIARGRGVLRGGVLRHRMRHRRVLSRRGVSHASPARPA